MKKIISKKQLTELELEIILNVKKLRIERGISKGELSNLLGKTSTLLVRLKA
ncbi:hypothetical protein [Sphingobacterium sp. CZ-2]|uniref:hypothetical protein n=1 Tax=Sphingobacterium sp. CZ-2 TaxID=2557994 RepID=UPI001430D269|nr:hypothetical protein [Sphingobacterium sp. CZ-2]